MKTLNKIFLSLGVVAATFTFSSCTGDLDQLPTDPNSLTNADFASDPDKYMDETMAGLTFIPSLKMSSKMSSNLHR